MPDSQFVQDLIQKIEQVYANGALALNRQHGLTPPDNPTSGNPGMLKARRLGIAMHSSLLSLNGRDLHAELTLGIDRDVVAAVDERWVLEFAKQMASTGLAPETMQVLLIGAEVERIRGSVRRADEIIELIRVNPLGEIASLYMQRATRLFLAGFDEACVIMCASVIEAAYANRFDDGVMIAHRKGRRSRKRGSERIFGAFEYEDVALRLAVFSEEDGVAAARLRDARNDIVHLKPDQYLSSLDALKTCALLLDRLFPQQISGFDGDLTPDFLD